jgi:large subunit ribosomal protein L25
MAEEILLGAQARTVIGKQVNAMRRQGVIPGILYGNHLDQPVPINLEEKALKQVVAKAGRNRLIKLSIDGGAARLVLAREVQRNSLSQRIVHVDLQEVSLTEKITTEVPLVLVGISPAVTRGEGLLIHGINTVQIRVLPTDLIPNIEVDVTVLNALNQGLYVRDLKVGDNIQILTNGEDMVAKVVPVKEEVVATEAPVAAAEVEVVGKKKEDEEGEAGEGKKEEKK